jgi:hypothetical protein
VGGLSLRAELLPQVVQFTLQGDHLLAEMHNSRGSSEVDAKVIDETPYPLHVLDIRFGIESTAPGPNWLEEPPLFVPPQGPFVDATAGRNDGDRVTWLVSRAVVNNPIRDGYAEYFGFPSLRHQDDRSCRIWRSSS